MDFFDTTSAEGAVQLAILYKPTVMLMAVGLPGINGITAARWIKQVLPQIKIIIHTIHDEKAYHADADSAGADGYITKSKTQTDLLPLLQEIFEGCANQEETPFETNIYPLDQITNGKIYNAANIRASIEELWQALKLLDRSRTQNALNQISEIDRNFRGILKRMLINLDYQETLRVLEILKEMPPYENI